jgi:hypothetical protein
MSPQRDKFVFQQNEKFLLTTCKMAGWKRRSCCLLARSRSIESVARGAEGSPGARQASEQLKVSDRRIRTCWGGSRSAAIERCFTACGDGRLHAGLARRFRNGPWS